MTKHYKLPVNDVMSVDKAGIATRETIVAFFHPETRQFSATLPRHVTKVGQALLEADELFALVGKYEEAMSNYQRAALLAGSEEMIMITVLRVNQGNNTVGTILMQVSPVYVRRNSATGQITTVYSKDNDSIGEMIPMTGERFLLANTADNQAKAQRLLNSISAAYELLASVGKQDQSSWQSAFDGIIESHKPVVTESADQAPAATPVQQPLPLDDEEL